MKKTDKVIITCAVTGSVHTPTMSKYLPITPTEVAEASIAAAEAGAAIIHLHARDPKNGKPTPDPGVFMEFLPRIKQNCNAVVNITTGGGMGMTLDERLAAPKAASPEMTSFNMGSMNFGLFQAAARFKDWKHDWEKGYLEGTKDFVVKNTFHDMERICKELGDGHGTKFEFECYDVGHLYSLAYLVDRGFVKPPFLIQGIFGILGGIGPDYDNLVFMRRTADRLFGEDFYFSVLAAGRHQMAFCTMNAIMGGSVRVGMEDSLYLGKGQMTESNAAQVAKIRRIIEDLSLSVATPDEARAMLGLKGGDKVSF